MREKFENGANYNEQGVQFSAGPAVLPEEILKEAAEADMRELMNIPDNYKVLFIQGGASTQFAMIPMNLMKNGVADYIVTGQFAKKAYKEATKYGIIYGGVRKNIGSAGMAISEGDCQSRRRS